MRCVRPMMGKSERDRIRNTKIRALAQFVGMQDRLMCLNELLQIEYLRRCFFLEYLIPPNRNYKFRRNHKDMMKKIYSDWKRTETA